MKKMGYILSAGLLFGSVGCVSSSKHKEAVANLESQIQKTQGELSAKNQENQNLKSQVSDLDQKLAKTTKDRGQLQASLDEMKKALEELRSRQLEQKKRIQEFQDLTNKFKSLTDTGAITVKIIDGKMVVNLGSDVLFGVGSSRLSAQGLETIKEVAKQLMTLTNKRYQVEGHTDNLPISTAAFPSNWELASARSINVVKAMIDAGMPAERVSGASYGDTSPIKPNDTPEGRAANRRIVIVVVPDLSTLPGYDELNKIGQ